MKFIERLAVQLSVNPGYHPSCGWSCPDFEFCSSQRFCKEKKRQKILRECSFHLNNTGRAMQIDCPLDIWWTWHLGWKSTLPRGRDSHQPSQGNSVSTWLHSGLWHFSQYYEFPLNHITFFIACFQKGSSWWGFAWLMVW